MCSDLLYAVSSYQPFFFMSMTVLTQELESPLFIS